MKPFLTAAMTFSLFVGTAAFADGDPEKGKKVFKKCAACHWVGADPKKKLGPILNGIVDAPAGQVEGFKYSKALLAMAEEGLVWNEASLKLFLTKPKEFMKGTKMSFKGLRKEAELDNIIAYLATFE